MSLLRPFIAHYTALGVEDFHIIRHIDPASSDDAEHRAEVSWSASGVRYVDVVRAPWHERLNQQLIRGRLSMHPDDWWIVADLDEFQVYNDEPSAIVKHCDGHRLDFVRGGFLDRLSPDGSLRGPASLTPDALAAEYPLGGLLTSRLLKARPTKVTLVRGTVALDLGQHNALSGAGAPFDDVHAQVHHFKWTASVVSRLARRVDAYRSGEWELVHDVVPVESENFLAHVSRAGRVDVRDERFPFHHVGSLRYQRLEWWERDVAGAWQRFHDSDVRRADAWARRDPPS